jgi:hypothetical protein
MTFSEWMVPELSVSASLELENSKRVLKKHADDHPEKVADLACAVMQQNYLQQSILRKATKRIAELEMTTLLSERQIPEDMLFVAGQPQSWCARQVLRFFDLRPIRSGCTKT